jgi:hypothetical protein
MEWRQIVFASQAIQAAASRVEWPAGGYCAKVIGVVVESGKLELFLLWNRQPGVWFTPIIEPGEF